MRDNAQWVFIRKEIFHRRTEDQKPSLPASSSILLEYFIENQQPSTKNLIGTTLERGLTQNRWHTTEGVTKQEVNEGTIYRVVFWVKGTRKRWYGIQRLARVKSLHYFSSEGASGGNGISRAWQPRRRNPAQGNWGLRETATSRMLRSQEEAGLRCKYLGPLFPPALPFLAGVSLLKSIQKPGCKGVSWCTGKRIEWIAEGAEQMTGGGRE